MHFVTDAIKKWDSCNYRFVFCFCILSLLFLVPGCGGRTGGHGVSYQPVSGFPPANHTGWKRLSYDEAVQASLRLNAKDQGLKSWRELAPNLSDCKRYAARKPQSGVAIANGELALTWGQMHKSLERMERILPQLESHPTLLAEEFVWYRIGPDISFTGYFEPTIKASKVKTEKFSHPIYRMPPDARKGRRYHDRRAIDEQGVLSGRGLELAWIEDKVDAFFLQVQGSGRLVFPDGTVKHVLYAGKNNCAYVSLGRVMKERGLLDPNDVSMRTIRNYLALHPQEVSELLCENPSYIFFRLEDKGPVGAMGVPLLPKVSLATDSSSIPLGSLMAFAVPLPGPDGKQATGGLLAGVGLAQDRGGAIKGLRADLFCGAGEWAEHMAGHLDTQGAVFMLVAK